MKPSEALAVNRAAIRQAVEPHRARNARVFGSVRHGQNTDSSGLDILIDPTPETTLLDIGAIRHELGRLLDAVIRDLEIIGEASNNIEKRPPEFAAAHPERPLPSAYEMRNAVAHGYSKWTSQSSGRRSIATSRACIRGFRRYGLACVTPEPDNGQWTASAPRFPE
jgi:predicted nucleotidyltransferase